MLFVFYIFTYAGKVAYNFSRFDQPFIKKDYCHVESYEESATSFIAEIQAEKYTLDFRMSAIDSVIQKLSRSNLEFLEKDIEFFKKYREHFIDNLDRANKLYLKVIGASTNGAKQVELYSYFQKFLNDEFNSKEFADMKKFASNSYEKIMHFK